MAIMRDMLSQIACVWLVISAVAVTSRGCRMRREGTLFGELKAMVAVFQSGTFEGDADSSFKLKEVIICTKGPRLLIIRFSGSENLSIATRYPYQLS